MRRASCWLAASLLFCWFSELLVLGLTANLQRVVTVLAGAGSALFAGAGTFPARPPYDWR